MKYKIGKFVIDAVSADKAIWAYNKIHDSKTKTKDAIVKEFGDVKVKDDKTISWLTSNSVDESIAAAEKMVKNLQEAISYAKTLKTKDSRYDSKKRTKDSKVKIGESQGVNKQYIEKVAKKYNLRTTPWKYDDTLDATITELNGPKESIKKALYELEYDDAIAYIEDAKFNPIPHMSDDEYVRLAQKITGDKTITYFGNDYSDRDLATFYGDNKSSMEKLKQYFNSKNYSGVRMFTQYFPGSDSTWAVCVHRN